MLVDTQNGHIQSRSHLFQTRVLFIRYPFISFPEGSPLIPSIAVHWKFSLGVNEPLLDLAKPDFEIKNFGFHGLLFPEVQHVDLRKHASLKGKDPLPMIIFQWPAVKVPGRIFVCMKLEKICPWLFFKYQIYALIIFQLLICRHHRHWTHHHRWLAPVASRNSSTSWRNLSSCAKGTEMKWVYWALMKERQVWKPTKKDGKGVPIPSML